MTNHARASSHVNRPFNRCHRLIWDQMLREAGSPHDVCSRGSDSLLLEKSVALSVMLMMRVRKQHQHQQHPELPGNEECACTCPSVISPECGRKKRRLWRFCRSRIEPNRTESSAFASRPNGANHPRRCAITRAMETEPVCVYDVKESVTPTPHLYEELYTHKHTRLVLSLSYTRTHGHTE